MPAASTMPAKSAANWLRQHHLCRRNPAAKMPCNIDRTQHHPPDARSIDHAAISKMPAASTVPAKSAARMPAASTMPAKSTHQDDSQHPQCLRHRPLHGIDRTLPKSAAKMPAASTMPAKSAVKMPASICLRHRALRRSISIDNYRPCLRHRPPDYAAASTIACDQPPDACSIHHACGNQPSGCLQHHRACGIGMLCNVSIDHASSIDHALQPLRQKLQHLTVPANQPAKILQHPPYLQHRQRLLRHRPYTRIRPEMPGIHHAATSTMPTASTMLQHQPPRMPAASA
jgi:hypothetical protein